ADLLELAQLLSGHRIDETGGFHPLEASELVNLWTSLRKNHPESFRRSSNEAFNWHEQQAQACEQAWNWWSATFHLDCLIENRPEDALLRNRRTYARMALAQANNAARSYLEKKRVIPPRNPLASPRMIDLTAYYNPSKGTGLRPLA